MLLINARRFCRSACCHLANFLVLILTVSSKLADFVTYDNKKQKCDLTTPQLDRCIWRSRMCFPGRRTNHFTFQYRLLVIAVVQNSLLILKTYHCTRVLSRASRWVVLLWIERQSDVPLYRTATNLFLFVQRIWFLGISTGYKIYSVYMA